MSEQSLRLTALLDPLDERGGHALEIGRLTTPGDVFVDPTRPNESD